MFCFFFNDTATTEIYTLSLHDALPISFRLVLLFAFAVLYLSRRIHAIVIEKENVQEYIDNLVADFEKNPHDNKFANIILPPIAFKWSGNR